MPLVGLAMLYPMTGKGNTNGNFNQWLVISGTVLLLVGVTALLPWVVEAVVVRLNSGSVSWQLAVRRLQLSSGSAARMVNGIAVAVAGAIALQMLFAGVQGDYTKAVPNDLSRAQMEASVAKTTPLAEVGRLPRAPRACATRGRSRRPRSGTGRRPRTTSWRRPSAAAPNCARWPA